MIPWTLIDRATVPGGGELRLMPRDDEFSIMLGTIQLMSNRRTGSEQALATFSCDRIRERTRPRVLIGGLGMGFTLRAALTVLGADARVTVAELVPAVIKWARGPLAGIFGAALRDPRLEIYEGDVRRLIGSCPSTYDAIMLDVDNGPEGLTHKASDRLYDEKGLKRTRDALKPGGILAIWSSTLNKPFTDRLRASGFRSDQIKIGANHAGGARSVVWIATPAITG